ncbi:IS5 family transposase [Martelella sp. UBA3392]|uniref:IS5 family transposase n=1 Tax=Martelella sp. UBA3392 TaxID=1946834 RepID=UPI0039C991A4
MYFTTNTERPNGLAPFTRRHHDRRRRRDASDLSDREWNMIAPFIPSQPRRGRRRKTSLLDVLDALFYLLQSGCQWALLPRDFPPKSTVHHYFKRFCRDGMWRCILNAICCRTRQLEGHEDQTIIDNQSVKFGSDARRDIGYDAGKKNKSRQRHILLDKLSMRFKVDFHSAGIPDRNGAVLVFDKLANRFSFIEKICGEGGYQGPKIEQASPRPIEIVKRNQAGFQVLPKRWIVERTVAWLGINRRLAKDFERFSATNLAFIRTAMIKIMTISLARYPLS